MVVNVEPSAQLPYQLYSEGPNTDDCDLITISNPLEVLKKTHQLLTEKTKEIDKPLLDKLEEVGFRLEYGEENTGWQFKYLTRGGGYHGSFLGNRDVYENRSSKPWKFMQTWRRYLVQASHYFFDQ